MAHGWKLLEDLPEFVLKFGLGFGIAVFVLGTFVTALTGDAANTLTAIITAVQTSITTYLPPVLAILFIVVIYALIKGVMGKGKGGT